MLTEQLEDVVTEQLEEVDTEQLDDVVTEQLEEVVTEQLEEVVAEQLGDVVTEQLEEVVTEQFEEVVTEQIEEIFIEQLEEAPDGGWGWFVVTGSFLCNFILCGIERSAGILFLELMDHFATTAKIAAWPATFGYTVGMLLSPLGSSLCNRFAIRTVMMCGSTLSFLGIFLSTFSPNIGSIFLTYGILRGVGVACTYAPSLIVVGQYFDKRRSIAAGIATSGGSIGGFVFPLLFNSLFNHYGVSGAFLVLSALSSHLYVSAALYRPLKSNHCSVHMKRKRKRFLNDAEEQEKGNCIQEATEHMSQTDQASKHTIYKLKPELKGLTNKATKIENTQHIIDLSLFKNATFTCLCIQSLFFSVAYTLSFSYIPAMALENGLKTIYGAYLMSIMGASDGIARILVPILLDTSWLGPYRLLVLNFNCFILAICVFGIPFMSNFGQLSILAGLIGIPVGVYSAQFSVVCRDVVGLEHMASSVGLVLAVEGTGALLSPVIGGQSKEWLGSYAVAFYIGGIGIFVGAFVMALGIFYSQRRNYNGYSSLE